MNRLSPIFSTCFISMLALSFLLSCSNFRGTSDVARHSPVPDPELTTDYEIGPEDVLEIVVWKNQSLSKIVTVRPDGKISLPLAGDFQATGLTPIQLRDEISSKLKPYYREIPEVSVIVQQVNSHIYILGEVQHPGRYVVKSGTTVLQAISLAGGLTPFASTSNVILLRKETGSNASQQESAINIPYRDLISGRNLQANLILRTADTIIVH